ncbi:MAG: selenocysteine-specific translation elongation factor [Acidimicrobiales bacterium]
MRVVATAGHVDHGKSSLVLALTGTDPDRFAEEKRRGLTIDLGFAHAAIVDPARPDEPVDVSFVDVPGHVRFVRNMLAGVGGVDACLFVVAATEGWKPQSEEHLRILQLLGHTQGVVVLTKRDLVDDEWLELQALEVADHLAGTFLADAPVVAVSAHTGEGLDDLRAALVDLVHRTAPASDRDRPRLWVDRSFAARGSGTVVTGTLTGGSLHADQRVELAPGGREVRIRSLQRHGRSETSIGPGNRVAVNLTGVEHHAVTRGDAIVAPGRWRPSSRVDATLDVLAALDHEVSRRGAYVAYIGSGEWPVKVRILGPAAIVPGETGLVRLHLSTPLPLSTGDRYVLRESGRNETVGGGTVLDVAPVLPASRARPDGTIETIVSERGWVLADDLEAWTGLRIAPSVARWVVSPAARAATEASVRERIAAAGALGLDLATLDERERALVGTFDDVRVDGTRLLPIEAVDPLADHPVIELLRQGGAAPPEPTGIDRAGLRELIRRGVLVERDGIVFHVDAIDGAARTAARLLAGHPDGITVAQLRDELGISRKYALPLVNELDARGVTRRRGDLRIGGPRLPAG